MFAFGLTIFTGAFLLFLVQPLIGKFVLPWFGGSPAVWTTCMLFFQVLLLGGYAYAHWSTSRLKPRHQVLLHLALLGVSLLLLPVTPGERWKPPDGAMPALRILLLLGATLGLPYLALSATGPLMQAWFSRTHSGVSPYRLYALSNVGSLLALVSYPFWVEPYFSRHAQAGWWSAGLAVFAALAGWCGWMVWKQSAKREGVQKTSTMPTSPQSSKATTLQHSIPIGARLLWFALPSCASVLLLAVTNKICQDIVVMPFLWVLPLGLYLVSFIISFERERWYWRPLWLPLFVLALLAVLWVMMGHSLTPPTQAWLKPVAWILERGGKLSMFTEVTLYLGALFIGCLVCHGEVFRLRPVAVKLTGYYLMIAAGGACGGLFVAVVAPLMFNQFLELHLGLFMMAVLVVVVLFTDGKSPLRRGNPRWAWALMMAAMLGTGWGLYRDARAGALYAVELSRNFYGALKVSEYNENLSQWHKFSLWHGATQHGFQFAAADKRRIPTSYYTAHSGIGLLINHFPRQQQRRIGVVGLGAGSVVVYGKEGDYFRLYEINDDVVRLARTRFTYLQDCEATTEIVLGDARLSMEREKDQQFDILVLDAFTGDAIPTHLLTREAFEIYERHLLPSGAIALHISNRWLNLRPVVMRLAEHFGFTAVIIDSRNFGLLKHEEDERGGAYSSTWVLLSKNADLLRQQPITEAAIKPEPLPSEIKMWTDEQSDLMRVLNLQSGWR